jgi:hypothetical protein
MIALFLLLASNPGYGPLVDKYTGRKCPVLAEGADIHDASQYRPGDMGNTPPQVMYRCLKMREALLNRPVNARAKRR